MNSKLVVMYRVKNEERWIKKSVESVYDLCSEIVVLDDGSTDNTREICSKFDKVIDIHHQENLPLDEARDRNLLLQMALKRNPDIIFSLDGDEILISESKNILFEELDVLYPDSMVFEFQFLTLWDKLNQIRYDGAFSNHWQKRLFRVKDQPQNLEFSPTNLSGNLHCGSIPTNTAGFSNPIRSNVKIIHCASLDKEQRQKKYEWYNKIDPNNTTTDSYKHMIGGFGRLSGPNGLEFIQLPSQEESKLR